MTMPLPLSTLKDWFFGGSFDLNGGNAGLELLAKFSVMMSLLVVVWFLATTTYRIARLPQQGWPLFHLWGNKQEIHQKPTPLPFVFQLEEGSVAGLDGFRFKLKLGRGKEEAGRGRRPKVLCLWGVEVNFLFSLINAGDWVGLSRKWGEGQVQGEKEERDRVVLVAESIDLEGFDSEETEAADGTKEETLDVKVKIPERLEFSKLLGQYKYPLAMFLCNVESKEEDEELEGQSIVGLCVILHVKHELIPKSTAVLDQYIKLQNGHTLRLRQLYVMDAVKEEDNDDNEGEGSSAATTPPQPFGNVLCSVCQSLPVSRVIVPCGHLCLCANCFGKVGKCPICRGQMTQFFKTRNEDYME